MTKNINDISETEFVSVEDPINMHKTTSDETIFALKILIIINEKNGNIAPRQGKKSVLVLSDEF